MLPKRLEFQAKNGKKVILEMEHQKAITLFGVSPKSLYRKIDLTAPHPDFYIVKGPKERKVTDVLSREIAPHLSVAEKQKHLLELQQAHSFLQVLAPQVARVIFGASIVVPKNYFFLNQNQQPVILSRYITVFHEFLCEEKAVRNKVNVWSDEKLPKRADIKLTPPCAEVLGKLFFVGLLMGHWDLLNNINLSNSGLVKNADGKLVPVIVDWGNAMGVGFGELSADESAFKNPDLQTRAVDFDNTSVTGFQHCVPFDTIVYPLLPRQIIKDIFNLSDKSELSQAVFKGFKAAFEVAIKSVTHLEEIIPAAIDETLASLVAANDVDYVKKTLLNQEIFFPQGKQKNGYTLVNVLRGRLRSLQDVVELLEQGNPLERIAQLRLREIMEAQDHGTASLGLKSKL